MDWDDFKYVQAVARTGSVRGAGELLKVHGSTVTRHLDHLERRVGTRLFARTPRGMEITASGAQVIEVLDRVASELDQVESSLRSQGPAAGGPVSLAVSPAIAAELLIPMLGTLYRTQPGVDLVLPAGHALENLQHGNADLAVCVTDDPPEDLIGRPLATAMSCAYAAPGYLQGMDRDSGSGRWVGSDDPASLSVRARYFADLPPGPRVDDVLLRAAALEAGLGVGLLPCYLGDERPRLVRAGEVEPVRQGEVWLFSRPEARGQARIQVVSAFLQDLFGRQQRAIEGVRNPPEEAV